MKYLIELEVREPNYKDFIEYFDPNFDEWEDEDKVEDRVYELLRHEDYDELVNCPYVWVDER
jgi:hypothetical protein